MNLVRVREDSGSPRGKRREDRRCLEHGVLGLVLLQRDLRVIRQELLHLAYLGVNKNEKLGGEYRKKDEYLHEDLGGKTEGRGGRDGAPQRRQAP